MRIRRGAFCNSAILLATLLYSSTAFAIAFEYPAGEPIGHPGDWPNGLKELANSEGRVHGYSINTNDTHFYRGDVCALNAFLKEYAKVKTDVHSVTLLAEKGRAESPWWKDKQKQPLPCDWKLTVARRKDENVYNVSVEVYLDGQLSRKKIEVPEKVVVHDRTQR